MTGQNYTSYTVDYGANGQTESASYGNGKTAAWTYNADGLVSNCVRRRDRRALCVLHDCLSANGQRERVVRQRDDRDRGPTTPTARIKSPTPA